MLHMVLRLTSDCFAASGSFSINKLENSANQLLLIEGFNVYCT